MVTRQINASEGLVWMGFGLFICVLGWRFDLGSFREPGPGFMAFFSGLFLFAIGLIMAGTKTLKKKTREGEGGAARPVFFWRRLAFTAALLLLYVLFLEEIGYVIATFLLLAGMSYDRKKGNGASSALFSLIAVASSYLVFEVWLKCQLPRGLFPWW